MDEATKEVLIVDPVLEQARPVPTCRHHSPTTVQPATTLDLRGSQQVRLTGLTCVARHHHRAQVDRDLAAVEEMGGHLVLALNTHAHADHITGSGALKRRVPGLRSAISAASGAKADQLLAEGEEVSWAAGTRTLKVLPTPGHTTGCVSYYDAQLGVVFTGDTLLIRGCGRTDFQVSEY